MPPSLPRRAIVRAIDTNVVVRFLTGDDPGQAEKARKLIGEGEIFVATSVLLESEWVLRSAYGFSADQIVGALRAFAGLPGIALEDAPLASRALDWTEQGLDFADALHLGRAEGCSAFMSFDRNLARAASSLSEVKVVAP
jgi:predicted nucleic-acid-binding protein